MAITYFKENRGAAQGAGGGRRGSHDGGGGGGGGRGGSANMGGRRAKTGGAAVFAGQGQSAAAGGSISRCAVRVIYFITSRDYPPLDGFLLIRVVLLTETVFLNKIKGQYYRLFVHAWVLHMGPLYLEMQRAPNLQAGPEPDDAPAADGSPGAHRALVAAVQGLEGVVRRRHGGVGIGGRERRAAHAQAQELLPHHARVHLHAGRRRRPRRRLHHHGRLHLSVPGDSGRHAVPECLGNDSIRATGRPWWSGVTFY